MAWIMAHPLIVVVAVMALALGVQAWFVVRSS